jgi:hypothetical protein
MLISKLIQNINTQLDGELLGVHEVCSVIDKSIDDINARLNTCFPVLSDLMSAQQGNVIEYTAIPDRYIRTVVIPGAVFKYYTNDEEGAAVAPKHEEEFLKGLFFMERDYMMHVPEQYQCDGTQGYLPDPHYKDGREGGLTIDTSVFQL